MQITDSDPFVGKVLNNRYQLRELIGTGGMGRVYRAEDTARGMSVAVKILSLSLANQQMTQRFAREIFIGAQLGRKSIYIVRVLGYGVNEDQIPFYVMEYLQGQSLKDLAKERPLPLSTVWNFCHQICLGLQCAHNGINIKGEIFPVVHRDIKPANIFVIEDSKLGQTVKILDFGIAKFLTDRAGMTLTNSFIGSLPYCSPEQMEGRKLLDVRSDIYSLGVLMFEMLTGQKPLQTETNSFGGWYQAHRFQRPRSFDEDNPDLKVPIVLKKLVMSCLAKETSGRPQNIGEVLKTLELVRQHVDRDSLVRGGDSPVNSTAQQLVPVAAASEAACWQTTWPKNKPIAEIVFPHLLPTSQGTSATLWAMLSRQELRSGRERTIITHFLATMAPYPMLLWIAVLHGSERNKHRWLSYFLDLKGARVQQMVRLLVETGYYHLLFFALEDPTRCFHVRTLTLTPQQRQLLADWLEHSEKSNPVGLPGESKSLLKAEYEKAKESMSKLTADRVKAQLSQLQFPKTGTVGVTNWLSSLFGQFLTLISRQPVGEKQQQRSE